MVNNLKYPQEFRFLLVDGKKAKEKGWKKNPLTEEEFNEKIKERKWKRCGQGLLLGEPSGGVVAIDIDGPQGMKYFNKHIMPFNDLIKLKPVAWSSGKFCRIQILLWVPKRYWKDLRTIKLGELRQKKALEFRFNNVFSVLPPSIHPDTGQPYKWINEINDKNLYLKIPTKILNFWKNACKREDKREEQCKNYEKIYEQEDIGYKEITQILDVIKANLPTIGYDDWRDITWAVTKETNKFDAELIMKAYWPEREIGEYKKLLKDYNRNRSPGIGTLIYIAKQFSKNFSIKKQIVKSQESKITINYISAKCGEGKTHKMLSHIAKTGGIWLYAVDKISPTISERKQELHELIKDKNVTVREAHTKVYALDDKCDFTVKSQLNFIKREIDSRQLKDVVIFITHKALLMFDWTDWSGVNLIIDEIPEIWKSGILDFRNSYDYVKPHFSIKKKDKECYILKPSKKGCEKISNNNTDFCDQQFLTLLRLSNHTNGNLFVKISQWDNMKESQIDYFHIFEPHFLNSFSDVWMVGNEIENSITYRIWFNNYKVNWVRHSLDERVRITPVSDRIQIFYFSENQDASFKKYNDDKFLKNIGSWIRDHFTQTNDYFFWTINERYSNLFLGLFANLNNAIKISPKAHGRNDLQEFTNCLWLGAMKSNYREAKLLQEVCGMNKEELDNWREREAMLQFVMRSNLRVVDSSMKVNVFVFSKKQAEFLQRKLGGKIIHIEGIVETKQYLKKGKRPKINTLVTSKSLKNNNMVIEKYRKNEKKTSIFKNINDFKLKNISGFDLPISNVNCIDMINNE